MARALTIVMYHYVRELRRSRYPEIKGLSTDAFVQQIRYIKRHYDVIGARDLMNAIADGAPLPPRPLLLTFDDGYIDHFTAVFPVLDGEKLPGCFFPPARCITEHTVLDVNKIHFVLASTPRKQLLVDHICSRVDENRPRYGLRPASAYWETLARPDRFDSAEVIFCKRMLQRELPLGLRHAIVDELFAKYVSEDESAFSRELYMSPDHLRVLQRHGMYVGSHGYDHFWLNTLSAREQAREVDRSLEFLAAVGADVGRWIMCYPYGAYDDSLLSVLRSRHCVAGLTTEPGLASLDAGDPLALPRLDTNDLPKDADAPASEWTVEAARREEAAAGRTGFPRA